MTLQLDAVTSERGIANMTEEWHVLWQLVPDATPFQHPDWLLAWWECFGTGMPVVLVARDAGHVVGVLPLYRRDEPGCRKLLPIGISLSDYNDALISPAGAGVADALFAMIPQIGGWDECYLPGLPEGAALLRSPTPSGCRETRCVDETCHIISLPPKFPYKKRQNLRRAWRATTMAGATRFSAVARDGVAATMTELFRLHEKRWRQRGQPGVCADPAARRFHCQAAALLGEAGLLRLHTLLLDDAAIAVLYGFAANSSGYAYLCAFDPDWASLGPGAQLLGYAIETAAREGLRDYHFLRGDEAHKHSWGTVARQTWARSLSLSLSPT